MASLDQRSPVLVPPPTASGSPVRNDDVRITGAVANTRQVLSGTGLTGGGDLTSDRTLAISFGTAAGTAAQGNDTRITGAVQSTRQVISGTGLTGGGDLSADRTLAVAYGTTSTTAAVGNDARLSDSRTPTAHASSHNAGGTDEVGLVAPAAKTANYTLGNTDRTIIFDTTSGGLTATLPTPVGRAGRRFTIKKLSSAGTIPNLLTCATAAGLIDGAATELIMVAGGFREFESDGTNWHIVGGSVVPVIQTLSAVGAAGTINLDAGIATIYRVPVSGSTATLAVPTNALDRDITIEINNTSGGAHTLTINASILLTTGLAATLAVPTGKRAFLGLRYISSVGWFLLAGTVQQ